MALIPRAVIGKYNDGVTYGLKVSLPGINALTDDDNDGTKFSFNSQWSDFVKIHAIGIATINVPDYAGSLTGSVTINFTALAYKPFLEIRRYVGNVVWDDYARGGNVSGYFTVVTSSSARVSGPLGETALYMVFRIPVPVS